MNDKTKQVNRIPFESLNEDEAVTAWNMPTVGHKKSKLVFSKKREQQIAGKTPNGGSGEIVEDYKGPLKPKPITAEELSRLAEEAKKEGHDTGYAEGFSKGLQEGNAKGMQEGQKKAYKDTKAKIDAEASRLASISASLLQPMDAQEEYLEKIIVDMAMGFAREILDREITSVPQSLLHIIDKALHALPSGAKNISVYVNQNDADLIDSLLPPTSRNWHIKVDNTLQSGGCRIETLDSLVDYTVESRLAKFLHEVRHEGDIAAEQVEAVRDYPVDNDMPVENDVPESPVNNVAVQTEGDLNQGPEKNPQAFQNASPSLSPEPKIEGGNEPG